MKTFEMDVFRRRANWRAITAGSYFCYRISVGGLLPYLGHWYSDNIFGSNRIAIRAGSYGTFIMSVGGLLPYLGHWYSDNIFVSGCTSISTTWYIFSHYINFYISICMFHFRL